MSRIVALTGASGFIGGHVAAALAAAGWRVRALVRRPGAGLPDGVVAVPGALEDSASLDTLVAGAQAIVHCAGLVVATDTAAFDAVNRGGTARLVAAAARQAPPSPRFVLMSSLAAREPELSAYAASKRAAERELARHGAGHSAGHGAELVWTVLRPPAVYGPGDRATLGFFRQFQRGVAVLPGAGGRLSLIHAHDLTAAVVALLDSPGHDGATLEVHDGQAAGYGWRDVAAAAGRALGRRVICVPLPRLALAPFVAVNAVARRAFGRAPQLTPDKLRELYHPDWVCRENPLAGTTGWTPALTIDRGFADTLAWYRAQGWL